MDINKKIREIDWSSYQHAYGKASDTPKHLKNLFSHNDKKVCIAIDKLDSSLCHQHVGVAPALEPAFPFLIEALPRLSEENLGLLLELFAGISSTTIALDHFHQIRPLDLSWTSIPDKPAEPIGRYVQEIREQLRNNRAVFASFLKHQENYIFDSAASVMGNFTETPVETAEELQAALSDEADPIRRDHLFSAFRYLQFEGKLDYLIQVFNEETNNAVKSTIAGQIAYEMKTNSPPEIVAFLSNEVLGTRETDVSYDYYEVVGIPFALAQPDKYEVVLQRFTEFVTGSSYVRESISFLAFALCWNGKPDFNELTPMQLNAIEVMYQKSWQGKRIYPTFLEFGYFSLPTRRDEMRIFLRERNS